MLLSMTVPFSEAMSDVGRLRTQYQAELYRDVTAWRAEIAQEMAQGARTAAAAYARYEGLSRLVRTLQPVESVEESDQPARNVTQILFASGQQPPQRGDIEAAIGYLSSLAEVETPAAAAGQGEQADEQADEGAA